MNLPDALCYGKETDPFYVGYVKRKGRFTMQNDHFHPQYEIYYLCAGERQYFIKDRCYDIQKGDVVFIRKNEIHKTLHAGAPYHERIIIYFNDNFFNSHYNKQVQFLMEPFEKDIHVLRLPVQEQKLVENLLFRMMNELKEKELGYEVYLTHSVIELLLVASRHLQKSDISSLQHVTPMNKKISDIVKFINAHYSEPVNLNLLSTQFFISSFYLSRMFKENTGFTFTDYLNITRLKEAQRLLTESNLKITEIAEKAGFDNFSHFGKMFKKIARVSPRAYRQMGLR